MNVSNAGRARVVMNDVLNSDELNDEWTTAYLLAGVIAAQLAIVDAIDNLSQTMIDKLPDQVSGR